MTGPCEPFRERWLVLCSVKLGGKGMNGGRPNSEDCVDDGPTACTDGVTTYGGRSVDVCIACTEYEASAVVLGKSEAKVPLPR
jgi:hypothetical protein